MANTDDELKLFFGIPISEPNSDDGKKFADTAGFSANSRNSSSVELKNQNI